MRAVRNLLLFAVTALVACDRPSTEYFPLQGGLQWEYHIRKTILKENHEQKLIVRSLAPRPDDDRTLYPHVSATGKKYNYYKTSDGIFRQVPGSGRENRILKFPLQPGTSWTEPTWLFLFDLPKRLEDGKVRISRNMTIDYRIESMTETVTVKAGRFYNCMRVAGIGFLDLPRRMMLGVRMIKVEDTEWYCPGIGLAKKVRKEYATPMDYPTDYVQELQTYTRL